MVSWAEEFADQKERLFLWIPVAFGAGIAAYFAVPFEPHRYFGVALTAGLIPLLAKTWRRHHDSVRDFILYLAAAAFFCAACGFFAAQAGTALRSTRILEKPVGPKTAAGFVESVENMGDGSRVVLSDVSIESVDAPPKKLRLKFKKDEGIEAGQTIGRAIGASAHDFVMAHIVGDV